MTSTTLILLILIGMLAGAMSGFVGIGGGVIMVPALVYVMGLSQFAAQGTSLILMLPPIGVFAVMNYYKAGHITNMHITYGIIIAVAFVIGGYFGSKLALRLSESVVKIVFGLLMFYLSFKMIYSGISNYNNDKKTAAVQTNTESDTLNE